MNGCVTDAMIDVITEMVPSRACVEKAEVANARSGGYICTVSTTEAAKSGEFSANRIKTLLHV
jgi:hypothetical protein